MSTLTVVVNGRTMNVAAGATIADLIAQLKLAPQMVVVEHNGQALLREQFSTTQLAPSDAIEIAHMVGGG